MPTIEVIRSSPPDLGVCKHPQCRRRIEWVRTIARDKRMPLDSPVIVLDQHEREAGGFVSVIDTRTSHFATCPAAVAFRRRR